MELLVVTGMSGAGKSLVVDALEDLGYFCIDNIPPKLIVTFAQLLESSSQKYSKVAVVCDIRSGRGFHNIFDYFKDLKNAGFTYKVFLLMHLIRFSSADIKKHVACTRYLMITTALFLKVSLWKGKYSAH